MSALAKRRAANPRLVKRDLSYSVEEVSTLLDVHENTIRNWMANGLSGIDAKRPILFHGSDIIAFLKRRSRKRRSTCAPDQCYCFKCRVPRKALDGIAVFEEQAPGVYRLSCACEVCGTRMFKAASATKRHFYAEIFILTDTLPEHISRCSSSLVNCELKGGDVT